MDRAQRTQHRRLRRRCQELLRRLDLPRPFDLAALAARVAAAHPKDPRPVQLHPITTRTGPFGLWVATASEHRIYYKADTSPLHQEHNAVHELWHCWRRHPLNHNPAAHPAELDGWQRLLPDLDAEMVAQVVAHITLTYHPEDEAEAELGATLLLQRAGRTPLPPEQANPHAALRRLAETMEEPPGWTPHAPIEMTEMTRSHDGDRASPRLRRRSSLLGGGGLPPAHPAPR
jgi:hypothetical protein